MDENQFSLMITTESYQTIVKTLPKFFESNIEILEPEIKLAEEKAATVIDADSEDDIKWADEKAAEFRKRAKEIHKFCKDTLDGWSNPWIDFKDKCKRTEQRLEAAATTLADGAKVGKDKIKAKKRIKLQAVWDGKVAEKFPQAVNVPHFGDFFAKMTDQKTVGCWLNKGLSDSKIEKLMDAELDRCLQAFETIQANYGEESNEIKQKAWLALRVSFDVNAAINAVNAYKKEQAELAEAKRKDEERRKAEEEARKAAEKAREEKELADKARRDAEAAARAAASPDLRPQPQPSVRSGQGAPVSAVRPTAPASAGGDADSAADDALSMLKPTQYKMTLEILADYNGLKKLREWLDANKYSFNRLGEIVKVQG